MLNEIYKKKQYLHMYKQYSTVSSANELRTKITKLMNKQTNKDKADEKNLNILSKMLILNIDDFQAEQSSEENKSENNTNSVFSGFFSGFKSYFV
jgi:hypothetical protein